ncbi:putative photosynthetic complex assembly protein PuhE [Halomonas denitrificans]|nr:DUF3623 domain-containing protein [Halomonas denitrificans]
MHLVLAAVAFSTFLWWFSTGVIFFLNSRSPRTFAWSMAGGTLVLTGAVYGLWATAGQETVGAAFLAFSCGLLIWGWHTMSYYMGVVTGPRRARCPAGCSGRRRFVHALATSIHHELAIVVTAALLFYMTWGQPNRFGLWTFLALWAMHVSAKLNVFLGVRNLNAEFIPERLQYLTSYFRERPMNLLFPFSVTGGTALAILLAHSAAAAEATSFSTAGFTLLASLVALAVVEHWFMVLPIPADALWRWSLKHRTGTGDAPGGQGTDALPAEPETGATNRAAEMPPTGKRAALRSPVGSASA